MKIVKLSWNLSLWFLLLSSTWGFQGCSGTSEGGTAGPTQSFKKPADNPRPNIPLLESYERQGPNGELLRVPRGAELPAEQVILEKAASPSLAGSGEIPVSSTIKVTLKGSNSQSLSGKGMISVDFPLAPLPQGVSPNKLIAKVKLSTGVVVPLSGVYVSELNSYRIFVPTLMHQWTLGVVVSPRLKSVKSAPNSHNLYSFDPRNLGLRLMGWLTDLNWETCAWESVIHNEMTEVDVLLNIMPEMENACETLSALGLRAPRLWVVEREGQSVRLFHVIDSGSFYSTGDESSLSSGSQRTEEEMLALGQIYISYKQYQDYKRRYGIELGNIVIHELLHAVQAGYDIRYGSEDKHTSYKAYTEGTATVLGQTYQVYNSVKGADVVARDLRQGEHIFLDEPVDNPREGIYTKQTFFGYVAKKFNRGSFSYLHQLFEQIAVQAYPHVNKPLDDYLPLYRQGTHEAFLSEFSKPLSEIYYDFVEDRAFIHDPQYQLHQIDRGLKPNSLAVEFFKKEIKSIDFLAGNEKQLEYRDIAPLSSRAFLVFMPVDDCTQNCPATQNVELRIQVISSNNKTPETRMVTYAVDTANQTYVPQSRRLIDPSKPVVLSSPRGKAYVYVVLFMNGAIADQRLDLQVQVGPQISKISPNPAKIGDVIKIQGSGFGDIQGQSQVIWGSQILPVKSWSNQVITIHATADLESKTAPLYVRALNRESNKIDFTISNSLTASDVLDVRFDSRTLGAGGQLLLPVQIKGGKVTFNFRDRKKDSQGYNVDVVAQGSGTFDGAKIVISGTVHLSMQHEYVLNNRKVFIVSEESLSFQNVSGKWIGDTFFPGSDVAIKGQYERRQWSSDPNESVQVYKTDVTGDISIWEWMK